MDLPAGRVAFAELGDGPAAIFLHGYPLNGFQWRGAMARLSPHRRCIAPDLMGLGYSDFPVETNLSPTAQAAMIVAFMDSLEIAEAEFVANDSGLAIAQILTANHPDRVRSLLREKVLRSCPAPFADWEAGDVFQAVVELGLISKDPIAPPHCSLAKSMFRGNFTGYSAEHLVAGYRFILGWPQSLEQHLRAVTRGRSGPMATFLGRLGRYFTQGAADTPIRRLMEETVAPTLGRLNTPRKSNHIARHLRNPETLNTSEAALRFDADKKVVSRLAASSVCCIAKGTGPNGPQLFHAPYVEAAFNRWRGAVDVTKAAHLLGAPPYCIPAFIGAGFLQLETDADAILLAQGERLVTLASIRSLAKAIQNRLDEHASSGDPVPFRRAMIGVLDPTSWTKAVGGLLNGEIPVLGTRPFDSRALDSVMVSRDAFLGIRKADEKLPTLDVTVSASEAASLLGVSNTLVSGAVKLCLVRGYWGKAQVDVPLSEVRRWRQTFVGSQEVRELTGLSSQRLSVLMRDRGIKPLGEAYNTKFWDRRRVSSALGVDLSAI